MLRLPLSRLSLFVCTSIPAALLSATAVALPLDQLYEYPQYITGPRPFGIALADFDNDGQLDFATANYDSDDVSVFRGLFYDKFRPGVRYKTSRRPTDIVVGDFNNDNVPDIATYNTTGIGEFSGVVSVLIGNGDATFQPRTSFSTAYQQGYPYPIGLFVSDFNNDGEDDIVTWTGTSISGSVTVHIGNGDGTFQGYRTTSLGTFGAVAFTDVDGDDLPDLLYGSENDISLRRGRGNGFFDAGETVYSGGLRIIGLTVGDITGDGTDDLVGAQHDSFGTDRVVLLEGDGAGDFSLIDFLFREHVRSVVLADTNGDSLNEVILSTADDILVYKNLGGSFAAPDEIVPPGQGLGMAVGDLNNDTRDDLVVLPLSSYARGVVPMMSRPNGTLRRTPEYEALSNLTARVGHVGIGDFNLDGAMDIAASSGSSSELAVLFGKGNGRFLPRRIYATQNNQSSGVVVADFNGDNRPDVANVNRGGEFAWPTVTIRIAQQNGALAPPIKQNTSGTNSRILTDVASADFNEDGIPDLAMSAIGLPAYGITASGVVVALVGNSGGIPQLDEYDSLEAGGIATGDFNGDDNQDIVVTVDGDFLLSCLAGDGSGGFAARKLSTTNGQTAKIAAGDLNGDGLTDVVTAFSNTAYVHFSDGDCTFTEGESYYIDTFRTLNQIELADLDDDNVLDIVTTHDQTMAIMFLAGKGDGTFRSRKSYSTGDFPTGFATGDLNGDGKTDVAVGTTGSVSVLLHR